MKRVLLTVFATLVIGSYNLAFASNELKESHKSEVTESSGGKNRSENRSENHSEGRGENHSEGHGEGHGEGDDD